MRRALVPMTAWAALAGAAAPPAPPPLGAEIESVRAFARTVGEALWPGYGTAPFGFLLVERETETLLCHPAAPAGFTAAGRDPATGCARFVRPRSALPGNWLAAMPLFGPPSTIVMGTAEAAGLSPARWRATILHEHVHQWQAALPDYYPRVAALDLAGGDETGMWMLNFAFPYAEARVAAAAAEASRGLAAALAARRSPGFAPAVARYLALRRAFAAAAGERNWRYLEFQLWQEGVARWTEIALARRFPDPAVRADADVREREVMDALQRLDPAGQQRLIAYPLGAGEAMVMEACGPEWRRHYPAVLALGPLLEVAAARCGG